MAESKLDRQRKVARDLREENKDLAAEVDRPPLTGARIAARVGKGALGGGGAVAAGLLHGRKMGAMMEAQHLINLVGGVAQLTKFGVRPDGLGDLITEAPVSAMRGCWSITIKEGRG